MTAPDAAGWRETGIEILEYFARDSARFCDRDCVLSHGPGCVARQKLIADWRERLGYEHELWPDMLRPLPAPPEGEG